MTRVLLAIGSAILSKGLEALLSASPAIEVVGRHSPKGNWNQQVEELQPDVVILEARWDHGEAGPALPELAPDESAPAIVILADHPPADWVRETLRNGVRAILPSDATGKEIVAAVEAAAAGLYVLPPDHFDLVAATSPPRSPGSFSTPQQSLSPREIEVLRMLAEGVGNKEIAWRLGISEHTVKFHVNSIFTKLDASSRTEAVTIGIRQGLILI